MDEQLKNKLNQLIKTYKNYPLIIESNVVSKKNFVNATFIDANIPDKELVVIDDIDGLAIPQWAKQVIAKENNKTNLLVISGLDKIELESQSKFSSLFEFKQLSSFKLPKNLQIVILIDEGSRVKIDERILSFCLYYKVEK